MRQFQVIPIRISLKHNKYAKSRENVSEDQLATPAVDLIAAGAIKEVFQDKNEEVPAETKDNSAKITGKEIIADLKNKNKK